MSDLDLDELIKEAVGEETRISYFRWSEAQDNVLRRWYGRIEPDELAEKVSDVLRSETGLPWVTRTWAACQVRTDQIGLTIYRGNPDEVNLIDMAAMSEGWATYDRIFKAIRQKEFPSRVVNCIRLAKKYDFARWLMMQRELWLTWEEALEATEGYRINTDQGAAIVGVKRNTFGVYLQTGVIQGWKIPSTQIGNQFFWIADEKSTRRLAAAKKAGKLTEYLSQFPGYQVYRKKMAAKARNRRKRKQQK